MPNRIAVIGAGPAGMMAAVTAARAGADVTLIEKNEKLGKKLYITGKGRCNLTNACDTADFFGNVVHNGKFLYSAVYSFTSEDTIAFFDEAGLPLKTERGQRVFPVSDKSSDVIKTLEKTLKASGVKIRLNTAVRKITTKDGGFVLETGSDKFEADRVIVATGGLSYPSTGSTGDGYRFAEEAGHKVTEPVPSLVALTTEGKTAAELEGLSLKNVSVCVREESGKKVFEDFGEMLFTSHGVSGPVILSASAVLSRELAGKCAEKGYSVCIDLKPALDEKQLDARVLRDFDGQKNKNFGNSLGALLPSTIIPVIVRESGISSEKKVNEVTKEERGRLVRLLKNFCLSVTGTEGFAQAVVTAGGVNVKEIDPSTMESKLVPGLYFAGEVLDVDAFTGGFNIQIALSTGHLAGESAVL